MGCYVCGFCCGSRPTHMFLRLARMNDLVVLVLIFGNLMYSLWSDHRDKVDSKDSIRSAVQQYTNRTSLKKLNGMNLCFHASRSSFSLFGSAQLHHRGISQPSQELEIDVDCFLENYKMSGGSGVYNIDEETCQNEDSGENAIDVDKTSLGSAVLRVRPSGSCASRVSSMPSLVGWSSVEKGDEDEDHDHECNNAPSPDNTYVIRLKGMTTKNQAASPPPPGSPTKTVDTQESRDGNSASTSNHLECELEEDELGVSPTSVAGAESRTFFDTMPKLPTRPESLISLDDSEPSKPQSSMPTTTCLEDGSTFYDV